MIGVLRTNFMNTYSIYVQNHTSINQTFWLFMSQPEKLSVNSKIYANSSARVTLPAKSKHVTMFEIPIQYKLGARSENKAAGLDVRVSSRNTQNVEIEQVWEAKFSTDASNMAPSLKQFGGKAKKGEIDFLSNDFSPSEAKLNRWYPIQTFGLETGTGFVGMSWEAQPSDLVSISPNLKFFVNTGSFTANTLADYTSVKRNAAEINEDSFDGYSVTVTLEETGKWSVKRGRPDEFSGNLATAYIV